MNKKKLISQLILVMAANNICFTCAISHGKYSLYNYTHTHLGLSFILHWEKSSKLTKTFLSAIGQINIYHFWRQAYMKLVQCCLEWSDDKSMTTWQHFKIYWCGGTLNENISYKNSPSINIKKPKIRPSIASIQIKIEQVDLRDMFLARTQLNSSSVKS